MTALRFEVKALPMQSDGVPRVDVFIIDDAGNVRAGIRYTWTLDEWLDLSSSTRDAFSSLKVKCPTCRCRIYPGDGCGCCAEPTFETDSNVTPTERTTQPKPEDR
jgi:hypothetical protein